MADLSSILGCVAVFASLYGVVWALRRLEERPR